MKFRTSGTLPFTVNGTLIAGAQVINANGNATATFTLAAGATLQTANPNGIWVSGSSTPTFNYSTAPTLGNTANFVFNGSAGPSNCRLARNRQ